MPNIMPRPIPIFPENLATIKQLLGPVGFRHLKNSSSIGSESKTPSITSQSFEEMAFDL